MLLLSISDLCHLMGLLNGKNDGEISESYHRELVLEDAHIKKTDASVLILV